MQKGNISVQTENIFPIIKKFLYSDQEIFLRELVSNATDATSKLATLARKGEAKGDYTDKTIDILIDKEAGTLTIRDRGIGMTEEEVKKYLNQVALSSAQEFVDKYQDDASIIGHFGLGFYSAFMVADKVEVVTKSYQEGAAAVRWICEGDPSYEIGEAEREMQGTDVILHVSEDSKQYLEEDEIEGLLLKYCRFLPYPIRFGTKTETTYEEVEGTGEEGEEKPEPKKIETEVDNIINNTDPLWKKAPADLTDEDYKSFYRELYPMGEPPMFWIHLNIDYPFNLTGILYFPKVSGKLELQRNKIQLYSNQVYVTDNVSDIVPEFLTLLHGVIDSPDIPLNVSRSYLQADTNVKKITGYITKKVAEKLNSLFKEDREAYEAKWPDLGVFVKYGMVSEEKFYDRATKFALLENTEGKFFTLEEYRERIKENQTDKYDRLVAIYTADADRQHTLIESVRDRGYDVLKFEHAIDAPTIQTLEQKEEKLNFVRVDSATPDQLVQKDEEQEIFLSEEEQETVKQVFTAAVGNAGSVELKPLSAQDAPVQIVRNEFMRRMKEMQMMQGMDPSMFPDSYQVVVNANNPLVKERLLEVEDESARAENAAYLYQLAKLSQQMLSGAELKAFIDRSLKMM
ncbi:molecular chaperone HtpG [Lewinella marina]|uniref:Chaperone protein HtpG n=1 Tax=Neolewinella marina TaxID=438751 RepID=A0A2G0CCV2_9BACT|nr:molecular chaperone HtpG [Neolewinella marina]NJB87001.1 molecular chaperone HtpG [Neolewinella marina]PHK97806.1 molecular chaperone HtpG [Neolewinella marina]